jgi:transcriptional regulator with XRE-family HTH domain/quercetin dioxygenase-like cupin family protein
LPVESRRDQPSGPRDRAAQTLGERLRSERTKQQMGVRELARRVGVSGSLISQIELGRATPSVSTLSAVVQELNLSLDQLFSKYTDGSRPTAPGAASSEAITASPEASASGDQESAEPVIRAHARPAIHLGSGVVWESLSPDTGQGVDFLHTIYEVGGESAPADALIRHGGREYGFVIEGNLGVTVGFATHQLGPGDSITFNSTTPHRLFNIGNQPVKAIWCTVGDNKTALNRATT